MEINYAQFLTYKQKVFCDEYLTDHNATAAALKAGYSAKTALSGYLMTLPKVQLYLRQQMDMIAEKVQVNHEMILRELCKIAFGNMGNYFAEDGSMKPINKLTDDDKASLESITAAGDGKGATLVKLKMYNKLAALEKIARHLNFYKPEEKEPERIYVYVNENQMNADDSFDDYRLNVEAYAAEERAAELAEEDREREWAEATFMRKAAVAIPEVDESLCDIGGRKAEDEGRLGNIVEIPKNTEDVVETLRI